MPIDVDDIKSHFDQFCCKHPATFIWFKLLKITKTLNTKKKRKQELIRKEENRKKYFIETLQKGTEN